MVENKKWIKTGNKENMTWGNNQNEKINISLKKWRKTSTIIEKSIFKNAEN